MKGSNVSLSIKVFSDVISSLSTFWTLSTELNANASSPNPPFISVKLTLVSTVCLLIVLFFVTPVVFTVLIQLSLVGFNFNVPV